jgi:hypothetical protein
MPRKLQNPDSWFYNARLRAGFRNTALLAQRLGVPKGTAYQWERGSADPRPSFRPPARLMPQIADALKLPLPDLLEALWREKDGDPCPCGCGGKKSFSDTAPEAWTLAIAIPCAKCGPKQIRIRKPGKKGRHRKLCPTCASTAERIPFHCIGSTDHNAKVPCPNTISLRPFEINARQRLKDGGLDSRFDLASRTYQCNACASLERLHAWEEKKLLELYAEKYPQENTPEIRSRERRKELRRDLHAEFSPNFKPTPEAQELGRQRFIENAAAGKKYPKKSRANRERHWLGDQLPKGIRFAFCKFCKLITMTDHSKNPRYHQACHNEWERTPEGRQFQSLTVRGQEPSQAVSVAPSKRGRPKRYAGKDAGADLATAYKWLMQYCSPNKEKRKSLRQIEKKDDVHYSTVRDQIRSLVEEFKKLPTLELLAQEFRAPVAELIAAYDSLSKESESET